MRTLPIVFVLAFSGFSQGGCASIMALSGEPAPDLRLLTSGASRADVEIEFGRPLEERVQGDGSIECTYAYATGNEPSLARALVHGAFDALTLGIWEVAGVGIESAVDAKDHQAVVVYDGGERVLSVEHREVPRRPDEVVLVEDLRD